MNNDKQAHACLQALGKLLDLPAGTDLPKELPGAVQRLLEDAERYRMMCAYEDNLLDR